MPSNHLMLYRPFSSCPQPFPASRSFPINQLSSESSLCIRWPKYWSFSSSISPSIEYSGLISFGIDWFDLLAVQGTLKSLLQHHSSKISILWHSASFMAHFHIHTWRLEKSYLSLYRPLLTKWCLCSLVYCLGISWASLAAQTIKNLFAMQETWVWSLSRKDPLEKEMATHSSILAWRIPWTEEPGVLQSMGSQSKTRLSDKHFHF